MIAPILSVDESIYFFDMDSTFVPHHCRMSIGSDGFELHRSLPKVTERACAVL